VVRPAGQPVPFKRQGIKPSKLLNNAFNPWQPKTPTLPQAASFEKAWQPVPTKQLMHQGRPNADKERSFHICVFILQTPSARGASEAKKEAEAS